jgi:ATP/ADP translocase
VNTVGQAAPMATLMLLLAFSNTLIDNVKDLLVLSNVGAHCIPFFQGTCTCICAQRSCCQAALCPQQGWWCRCHSCSFAVAGDAHAAPDAEDAPAAWVVMPMSLLFLAAFQRLKMRVPRRELFPVILAAFMALLGTFGWVLLPNMHALTAHSLVATLKATLPAGMAGAIALVQHWVLALFFGLSELFGDVAIGLLFWGFAVQSTPQALTRTLFPLFCVGANVAQSLAGLVLKWVSVHVPGGPTPQAQALCALALGTSGLAVALHEVLCRTRTPPAPLPRSPPCAQRSVSKPRAPNLLDAARCAPTAC